jgi:hypothetical protein
MQSLIHIKQHKKFLWGLFALCNGFPKAKKHVDACVSYIGKALLPVWVKLGPYLITQLLLSSKQQLHLLEDPQAQL